MVEIHEQACDTCGRRESMQQHPLGQFLPPRDWYEVRLVRRLVIGTTPTGVQFVDGRPPQPARTYCSWACVCNDPVAAASFGDPRWGDA